MPSVGITEFKAHFSEYLRRVLEGEVFYIPNRGVEVAEFRPSDPTRTILWEMVDVGELAWSGEKPKLPEHMPANTGKPIADIVLEHRGPQWPEAHDETE
jgi:antitoxin (DNA-binding transcriptional repressor) of toxin-antitoxin stability system